MKKCVFLKTSFVQSRNSAPLISVSVGYPRIDGCDGINAFYEKWVGKIGAYSAKFADGQGRDKAVNCVRNIRIIPFLRFESDKRVDVTFDIIISENGKLVLYKRTAHSWNIEKQRLIQPSRRGKETFFDGETTVMIENLFGKIETRRMSEYVKETKIKK